MTLLEPRYERPPGGLAQGRYAAAAWEIDLLAGAVVLVAIGALVFRARKRRGGKKES